VVPFSGRHFPLPVSAGASEGVPDPILAAIEAHKAAYAAFENAVRRHGRLEEELPRDRRRSSVDVWQERIVETDDPRWIASEREVMAEIDAEADAAAVLVTVRPTTRAGLFALLQHALMHDTDGTMWPQDLQSDDGASRRTWQYFLIANLVEILPELVMGGS
jgi:hypothetical protein